jgi:hypothetical protein
MAQSKWIFFDIKLLWVLKKSIALLAGARGGANGKRRLAWILAKAITECG